MAKAQQPRLTITLEPPSALVSVGSVLATPDGNIVVNDDGFGGYQDGAIFVLDSTGRLLRRIPAVEVPTKPYPVWLAPVAQAVLPDGSLIVDYVLNYPSTPGLFRLRLDPDQGVPTPDQTDDAARKLAEAVFGGPETCQRVLQVATQPDGRILVVYGQECHRVPRQIGRAHV